MKLLFMILHYVVGLGMLTKFGSPWLALGALVLIWGNNMANELKKTL